MRKQRTRQHFIEDFGMNFKNMDVSYQEFEHALLQLGYHKVPISFPSSQNSYYEQTA